MTPVKEKADKQILETCNLNNFKFQVDPYMGCQHYCYYCYVLNSTKFDWTKEIRVHKDFISRLEHELKQIESQKIYMGYNSDPYQPCEKAYLETRQALQLFKDKGFSAGILTKSDLVLRDIDILKEMKDASVSVSVAFTDNQIREQFEANTIDTERRIEALRILKDSGIKTNALICPVIPHLTNTELLIEMLAPVTETIWIYGLSVQNQMEQSWQNVQHILSNYHNSQKETIESTILSRTQPFWTDVTQKLIELQVQKQLKLNIHI